MLWTVCTANVQFLHGYTLLLYLDADPEDDSMPVIHSLGLSALWSIHQVDPSSPADSSLLSCSPPHPSLHLSPLWTTIGLAIRLLTVEFAFAI